MLEHGFNAPEAAASEDGSLQRGGARGRCERDRGQHNGGNERTHHETSPEKKIRTDPGHRIKNIAGIGPGSSLEAFRLPPASAATAHAAAHDDRGADEAGVKRAISEAT